MASEARNDREQYYRGPAPHLRPVEPPASREYATSMIAKLRRQIRVHPMKVAPGYGPRTQDAAATSSSATAAPPQSARPDASADSEPSNQAHTSS